MSTKLYVYAAEDTTLDEAANAFLTLTGEAVALCYAAENCWLAHAAVHTPGVWTAPVHAEFDHANVYEARVFNTAAELRWLGNPGGKGKAIVLTDEPVCSNVFLPTDDIDLYHTMPNRYLLWGSGTDKADDTLEGWSVLFTARIGRLDIPCPGIPHHHRAILQTVEYLAVDREHGNAFVIDERLLGFAKGEACDE